MTSVCFCYFENPCIAVLKKALFLDGKFGAMMQVHIQNDGPVTIQLESPVDAQVVRLAYHLSF